MNLKKWNSLSPQTQKIIDEVSGAAASERFGKMFDKLSVPDINYMKKQGDTFITLAPEEKKRWAAAILPLRDKWIKDRTAKGLPADKVVNEMIRLSESFSQ
jgi:TRAP-type C4-dicarboxylate transport system substrate-binding protein